MFEGSFFFIQSDYMFLSYKVYCGKLSDLITLFLVKVPEQNLKISYFINKVF